MAVKIGTHLLVSTTYRSPGNRIEVEQVRLYKGIPLLFPSLNEQRTKFSHP